jgi:hypothetical protein
VAVLNDGGRRYGGKGKDTGSRGLQVLRRLVKHGIADMACPACFGRRLTGYFQRERVSRSPPSWSAERRAAFQGGCRGRLTRADAGLHWLEESWPPCHSRCRSPAAMRALLPSCRTRGAIIDHRVADVILRCVLPAPAIFAATADAWQSFRISLVALRST